MEKREDEAKIVSSQAAFCPKLPAYAHCVSGVMAASSSPAVKASQGRYGCYGCYWDDPSGSYWCHRILMVNGILYGILMVNYRSYPIVIVNGTILFHDIPCKHDPNSFWDCAAGPAPQPPLSVCTIRRSMKIIEHSRRSEEWRWESCISQPILLRGPAGALSFSNSHCSRLKLSWLTDSMWRFSTMEVRLNHPFE